MKRLVNRSGLKAKGIEWCNAHLIRMEKKGRFPQRLRLGGRSVAWDEDEIDRWIEDRAAERNQASTHQEATIIQTQP
jgi:prophage regulatory protein